MRTWDRLKPSAPSHTWTDLEVLLSFNGPQVLLVDGGDGLYLSVASDEGPESTRWLRARISLLEKQALLLGAVTVRDCILKPEIWVVDTNRSGAVIMEASVTPEILSEVDLPSPDSFLPDDVVAAHKTTAGQPSIILNGAGIVHGVEGSPRHSTTLESAQPIASEPAASTEPGANIGKP